MDELKKCPFCGGEAKFYISIDNCIPRHPTAYVYCKKCHVSTRVFTDTKNDVSFIEDAKNAWNGRI